MIFPYFGKFGLCFLGIFRVRLGFETWGLCIRDSFLDSLHTVVVIFKEFLSF